MHSTQLVPRLLIRSYSKSWYGFAEPFWTVREKAYEFGLWTEGVAVVIVGGVELIARTKVVIIVRIRFHSFQK